MSHPHPSHTHTSGGARIGLFEAYPDLYYGAQQATHALARSLRSDMREVSLFVPAEGVLAERFAADGLMVTVVRAPAALRRYGSQRSRVRAVAALPRYWWRLRGQLRGRVDLLHINDHRGLLVAGPAARLAGVPVVWHIHTPSRSSFLNALGRHLAAAVIVASQSVIDDSPGLPPASEVHVVPLALPDKLRHAQRITPGPQPIVVTAGRLHEVKGFDVLLDAAALVRRRIPDLEVKIFGEPQAGHEEYADGLRRRARELGLEGGAVTFEGYCDDLTLAWKGARLYVQPSRREAFGLAALEAMAVGLPVVASRVGGLAENVTTDSTGILVPPADPDALADAMLRVLDDAELAQRLATGGYEWVHRTFTLRQFVTGVEAAYRSALRATGRQ